MQSFYAGGPFFGEDITPLTVNEACQINQFWAVKIVIGASSVHVVCVKDLVEMFHSLRRALACYA